LNEINRFTNQAGISADLDIIFGKFVASYSASKFALWRRIGILRFVLRCAQDKLRMTNGAVLLSF
jgi:hypothetical protein